MGVSKSGETEQEMTLTQDQITAGAAYTVRIGKRELSFKRGNDAVALVKGIDGQREAYVADPQNPKAFRTGYVVNEDPATATAKYNPDSRTWTVTIPAAGGRALADLRTLAGAYGAEVTPAAEAVPQAAAPEPAGSATRRASRLYGTDMAEYGDGFSPEERRAFGGR